MKLCKELIDNICKHISEGLTYNDAAYLEGINKSTFHLWKSEAKKSLEEISKNPKYKLSKYQKLQLEFIDSLKKADLEFKKTHIKKIARDISWQSSAWILERKYFDEFGKKMDVTSKGEAINIVVPEGFMPVLKNNKEDDE